MVRLDGRTLRVRQKFLASWVLLLIQRYSLSLSLFHDKRQEPDGMPFEEEHAIRLFSLTRSDPPPPAMTWLELTGPLAQ